MTLVVAPSKQQYGQKNTGIVEERLNSLERANRLNKLRTQLETRILIMDGAMGTMVQSYGLDEEGFRGNRFSLSLGRVPSRSSWGS